MFFRLIDGAHVNVWQGGKMGDFIKQKWPCILTCNLDTNQVKNVIFVRMSS